MMKSESHGLGLPETLGLMVLAIRELAWHRQYDPTENRAEVMCRICFGRFVGRMGEEIVVPHECNCPLGQLEDRLVP